MTASIDISYQEAYQEMRRYRDKQQEYARWFVSICLAIFAGVIAAASQDNGNVVLVDTKLPLIGFIVIFALISIYQIIYMDDRYHELRHRIHDIEPEWKKTSRTKTTLKPTESLVVQIILLTILLLITIYSVIK